MPATPYGRLDNWREGASLDEARGRELAASLELRARAVEQVEIRAAYLDLLGIAPGQRVLAWVWPADLSRDEFPAADAALLARLSPR